jgi:S1-C subfamily serine protease
VPEDISNEQAAQYGLAQGGVLLANLYVSSPAQQAGLQPGDLILALDGAPVRSAQDALGQIATHKPGSRIAIHVMRGRHEIDVHAQVSERPRNN